MLEVGHTIDRYVVEGLIGSGGMADVYRVRHQQLDSLHAIKVLKTPLEHVQERLKQEGRVQARLRHPNIVAVTDLLDIDGSPGLVMEYIDGPTLEALLSDDLSDEHREAIALGILRGVDEAHRQGLVHRDLKPANVLITWTDDGPVPKIADFGLVKSLALDEGSRMTSTGYAMGTPQFMAPEQIRDAKNVDERADLFSLGALLYELVCGQTAFPGEDILEVFNRIAAGRYVPPKSVDPDIPERIDLAIRSALVADRDARVPDCQTLIDLWTGRQTTFAAPTPQSVGATMDPGSFDDGGQIGKDTIAELRPSKLPIVGVAVAALAGIGGLAWVLTRPADVPAPAVEPAAVVDVEPVEVEPEPAVEPEPEPAEVEPEPVVEPASVARQPEPVAPQPEPVVEEALATLIVEGDADAVWLVGPSGRVDPGPVPAGDYSIKAVFGGGEAVSTGTLTLAAGETRTLRCSAGFTICK